MILWIYEAHHWAGPRGRRPLEDAIRKAKEAAKEIIADRIAHGELPIDAANAEFALAA